MMLYLAIGTLCCIAAYHFGLSHGKRHVARQVIDREFKRYFGDTP